MSQFDASDLDCVSVQCAVCESVIKGGKWFARVIQLVSLSRQQNLWVDSAPSNRPTSNNRE